MRAASLPHLLLVSVMLAACSGDAISTGGSATGGLPMGGSAGAGGDTPTGGADATGGSVSSGPAGSAGPGTGGITMGGSSSGIGGAAGTGESAGSSGGSAPATGGMNPGTGGVASGGAAGTGGSIRGVSPIDRGNGRYVLQFGGLLFEVDALAGARVVTFALHGQNILTGKETHPEKYGSTFTVSPRSEWGWTPPADFEDGPYQVSIEDEEIVMTSRPSIVERGPFRLGPIQVTKRFSPDFTGRGVRVEYVIANVGSTDISCAPSEDSRVLPHGITFFPPDLGSDFGLNEELPLHASGPWLWWPYSLADVDDNPWGDETQTNGAERWVAHAAGNLLLLKMVQDTLPGEQAAPGDGISIYASKPGWQEQGAYVEIKQHGKYTTLRPTETLAWTVNWYLHALPAGADLTVGDPELVAFTQGLDP